MIIFSCRMMLTQLIFVSLVILLSEADNQTSTASNNTVLKHPYKKKINPFHALFVDYFKHSTIFTTTVDFTIPLFSFKVPTLENPNDHTSIVKQNLIGQFLYFAVALFSFIASIALPAKLSKINTASSRKERFNKLFYGFQRSTNKCIHRCVDSCKYAEPSYSEVCENKSTDM